MIRRDVVRNSMASLVALSFFNTDIQPATAMYENGPTVDSEKVVLGSGVSFQDLRPGDGDEIIEGKRVNIQWSLKRSNGYIIDSSANNDGVPFIFVVGSGAAIKGLDEGIRGMKVGGIRRIVIPPSLSFVDGLEDTYKNRKKHYAIGTEFFGSFRLDISCDCRSASDGIS